jgi:transposase
MGEGMVAGIDWASEVHVACVMGGDGTVASRFSFTHDGAAIRAMAGRLRAAGVAGVAIERGDGPVVEELLSAGLAVFVVPSRQIKGLRTRYGSAGNKDDRFDAYVLADTLRTDGHRWKPLRPDTGPTRALRAACRSRKDLVETRVQVLGQLRANLELAFPGTIGLFTKLYSAISLAFLQRFPTAAKAAWLSPKRLASWLSSVGYTGGVSAGILYDRLAAAAPGLAGAEGEARGQITLALVRVIGALNTQIAALDAEIGRLLAAHPDRHIFASLPRSGTVRAASLLAEIGDCRQRFPTDDALAALAGACPSTPPVRQANPGRVPLVLQQKAPRRGDGLRQRQPHGRPLGRCDLRRSHRPRLPPSARRPDPGPRLAAHHLALLARRHSLRPRPPPRPPNRHGLT